ncbi:hypothetical protein JCGZ_06937 [Jatropha curcas]|uniref:Uncharacterized protein n=1 Tax=Jatropha curcas TaxID=180498 RepID=A0A067J983_JATCU|nr:hypothetical protein JCGZ_06937 [Jatropha curcas]
MRKVSRPTLSKNAAGNARGERRERLRSRPPQFVERTGERQAIATKKERKRVGEGVFLSWSAHRGRYCPLWATQARTVLSLGPGFSTHPKRRLPG